MCVQKGTGEKLKHFRRISNFSQEGLAEASGISIRTIQRIEKGLSIGNAYSINALANALQINTIDLLPQEPPNTVSDLPTPALTNVIATKESENLLKSMNLSAIAVLLIPFSNIIFPAIILWKNKSNEGIKNYGQRILSFHILWMLVTLLLVVILPTIMLLIFEPLRGGGIPLAVPVYFTSVLLNVVFTIRFAYALNNDVSMIEKLPNIL